MESAVRRTLKPFSVEVKRGRNGAASAAPVFFSKLERQPAPVEKRPAMAPPEPAKPQRRILEAIVTEPAPEPVAVTEAPVTHDFLLTESVKPRRGRPPKIALVEEPVSERPKVEARKDSATIYTFARREVVAVAKPVGTVAAIPRKSKQAVAAQDAPVERSAPVEFAAHGHVNHAERVEKATSLPPGERWKRRLPKVLW
jgi:hypothetical protein